MLTPKSGGQTKTVPVRLFMNFDDKSEFIAFFIPQQWNADAAFKLCSHLVGSYKTVIDQLEQRVKIGNLIPGETSQTWSAELTFTGRVFIYYEDLLSLTQLAALEQLYKQRGLSPQFRGHDYLTLHWNEKRVMRTPTTMTRAPITK
jgi:hypothetical protein